MTKLIALVGPTAVGKTELSHKLAQEFGFEIVSCDSMQVYRDMNIGTAKPSPQEREEYYYHMLDIVSPDYHYSAGEYARDAGIAIEGIISRGKVPLVSGGSGLYLDALIYGISSVPKADPNFREKMTQEAEKKGSTFLHKLLNEIDAESAKKIHVNDLKRIIRALEIYELTGEPLSKVQKIKSKSREYRCLIIGVTRERGELYKRIEARVDRMFDEGLVEEVKTLISKGYNPELSSFQALGYREVVDYFSGKFNLEEAREKIKKNTRNFAKRQFTCFKKNKEIKWFNLDEERDEVFKEVARFLNSI